jgi:hypothetical protein
VPVRRGVTLTRGPVRLEPSRRLAALLMLVSGATHIAQLGVYGPSRPVLGAAFFGLLYLGVGLALLARGRLGLWLGAILPAIGGLLGVHRFLAIQRNPFSLFHVALDAVVVPICLLGLLRRPAPVQDGRVGSDGSK